MSYVICKDGEHDLGTPQAVVPVYGTPVPEYPSTVQRCTKCPVSIYSQGEVKNG